jgi:hypothetical protein
LTVGDLGSTLNKSSARKRDDVRRGSIVALASLALVASLALAPTAVFAGGLQVSSGRVVVVNGRAVIARSAFPRFFNRPFFPFGVPVLYAPPPFYEPWGYGAPQAAYSSPAGYYPPASSPVAAAPPPPPAPERDLIQYSDGRYELRGDGLATPYRWVWIPNPPPPPNSAREARLYSWIDAQGVMHVTDRWDTVPEQYRAQAKHNQSS